MIEPDMADKVSPELYRRVLKGFDLELNRLSWDDAVSDPKVGKTTSMDTSADESKSKYSPGSFTVPPETISWQEVQRLLIGILRQVDGNKVIIHPAEFEVSGLTLFQETNPVTGTVTIWFEQQQSPSEICGDINRTDDGSWQCTKPKDHLDLHGDGTGKSSLKWTNTRWLVPCAGARSLNLELILCTLADKHKEKHVGYDGSGERHVW